MRFTPSLLSFGLLTLVAMSAPRAAIAQLPDQPVPAPRVHIETADPDVVLCRAATAEERDTLRSDEMPCGVPICRAPCDLIIDPRRGKLRFGGRGMPPSAPFALPSRTGDIVFGVRAGSDAQLVGGVWLTVAGAPVAVGGVALLIMGMFYGAPDAESLHPVAHYGMAEIGGVMVGVGVGMLAGGIALLTMSKTKARLRAPVVVPAGAAGRVESLALRF